MADVVAKLNLAQQANDALVEHVHQIHFHLNPHILHSLQALETVQPFDAQMDSIVYMVDVYLTLVTAILKMTVEIIRFAFRTNAPTDAHQSDAKTDTLV